MRMLRRRPTTTKREVTRVAMNIAGNIVAEAM
jgi:hypothetical protein